MATIVYKNAKIFLSASAIHAQLNELNTEFKVEMLDATTFGNDTRIRKGGLYVASISGSGFFDNSTTVGAIEDVLFENIGLDEGSTADGNPVVITVFPNSVTEGEQSGYAMKGVVETLTIGGAVGVLLPLTFAVQGRGVFA